MVLQASTYESGTNCIDGNLGYSLKKKQLKQWIYRNQLTQPYVARTMRMSVDEFKGKLKDNEPFNREQLKHLINLMGARNAFRVIRFHSGRQRRKVYKEVFVKYKNEERLNG